MLAMILSAAAIFSCHHYLCASFLCYCRGQLALESEQRVDLGKKLSLALSLAAGTVSVAVVLPQQASREAALPRQK